MSSSPYPSSPSSTDFSSSSSNASGSSSKHAAIPYPRRDAHSLPPKGQRRLGFVQVHPTRQRGMHQHLSVYGINLDLWVRRTNDQGIPYIISFVFPRNYRLVTMIISVRYILFTSRAQSHILSKTRHVCNPEIEWHVPISRATPIVDPVELFASQTPLGSTRQH